MGMRSLTIFFYFFTIFLVQGQQYRFHQYRVEQGLPSDVTKAITQDSLGFLWIATDDGLVKYDGLNFTTYKNAFRSQYVKGFLHTRDGKLLAFGDLDVIEIQNRVDTVIFESVLKGQRYFNDSTIWFPKSMYEDRNGAIWIGEPRSIVRYTGGNLKRYDFGDPNRSSVFVRSFSFFEDHHGNFFAISYNGSVFAYDKRRDRFNVQDDYRLADDVSQVLYIGKRLLVASREGLFSAEVSNGIIRPAVNVFPIRHVSNLLLAKDSSVIVSTYEEDLYKVSFSPEFEWENLYYNFNGINSSYLSRENDIWVATDKGIVLVQKNLFVLGDINSQAHFVEGIAHDDENNIIYYCNKESLIELKETWDGEWERTVLDDNKNNYYQALEFSDGNLWAASGHKVLLFEKGKLQKTFDFSKFGNFVHDIFIDKNKNVWFSQAGSNKIRVIKYPTHDITTYEVDGIDQNEISVIREGSKGIYAMASGTNNYLFFRPPGESRFRNISIPITFSASGDLSIVDTEIHGDIVWMATSEGLLRFDHKTISRLDFGEGFEEYPVSSVEILDKDNILFSNSYGLIRYNIRSGEYWLYDENTGLPSNTITDHGILVTKDRNVWIGTSYGIAYANKSLIENTSTRTPYCVEARINGVSTRFVNGINAPYGSYITLKFSPISFPENKILLQWRLQGEKIWKPVGSEQLSLSGLSNGNHILEVRAKKNTGLGWSLPTQVSIYVDLPYWRKAEFFFLVFLLVALVAWGSYAISSAIMNKRKEYLQHQIRERTYELQKANEELTQRNTELDRFVYSASHDLSAPLKSILGLIRVAKMDQPGDIHSQYLMMMERSVLKLEDFIQEVVTYSRNTRMPVKLEEFIFTDFVHSLLQDHEYSPNFKHIDFIVEDTTGSFVVSDKTRMKIILNNLLSNAIKFHWIEAGRKPFVRIALERAERIYILKVSDNGRGIPDIHIGRIFEMFFRATDNTQGSGLGLYILKESVLKLGGTVEAFSRIEEGTTFVITLPVVELVADEKVMVAADTQ